MTVTARPSRSPRTPLADREAAHRLLSWLVSSLDRSDPSPDPVGHGDLTGEALTLLADLRSEAVEPGEALDGARRLVRRAQEASLLAPDRHRGSGSPSLRQVGARNPRFGRKSG